MKNTDIFGNNAPVQIEDGEWWFNGRIIQKQTHPLLASFCSFADDHSCFTETHRSFKEAVNYCLNNPCQKPLRFPKDYIGGIV